MKIKNKVSAKLFGSAMLSVIFLFSNCKKEDSTLPEPVGDVSEVSSADSLDRLSIAAEHVDSDFYNITNALPRGYVKDGSRDYTSYIQSAINKYSKVVFPGFPIMVNDNGLFVPSNRTLAFLNGSKLILKPSSKTTYHIIRINNASNVTLIDPYIVGDRYNHKGTSGEWGNGISVFGSSNVNISKARVENCWGDGIYIGKSKGRTNRDIRIFKPYLKNNRRDGISIIDANGLQLISPYAGFSNGTAPFSGINIEPNDSSSEIRDIEITNPVTEGNKGNGIQVGLGKMYGGSNKYVGISITGHEDRGSAMALLASCRTSRREGSETISGTFTVNGTDWQKNDVKPMDIYFPEKNLRFVMTRPKVMNTAGRYLSESQTWNLLTDRKAIWSPTIYRLTM